MSFIDEYEDYLLENAGHDAEELVFANPRVKQQVIAKACELYGIPDVTNVDFRHIDLGKRLSLDLDADDVWHSGTDRARLYSDYAFRIGDKSYGISVKGNTGNVSLVSASIKKKKELLYRLLSFKTPQARNTFQAWVDSDLWDPTRLGLTRNYISFNKPEIINAVRGLMFNGKPYVCIMIDLGNRIVAQDGCYLVTEQTLGDLWCDDERIFWSDTYDKQVQECTISVFSKGQVFKKIDFRIRFKTNGELRIELDPKIL